MTFFLLIISPFKKLFKVKYFKDFFEMNKAVIQYIYKFLIKLLIYTSWGSKAAQWVKIFTVQA